jgi:hypothetical protein
VINIINQAIDLAGEDLILGVDVPARAAQGSQALMVRG